MNRITVAALPTLAALATAGAALASSGHASAASTVIKTRSSAYGTILVNGSGRTLYLDSADKPPKFACSGGCLTAWPPVKAVGKLKAQGAAVAADLGSVKDGNTRIVTYKGHPLYTFASDSGTAISGENTGGFFVVSPSGKAITKAPKKSTTTTSSSTTSSKYGGAGGGGY